MWEASWQDIYGKGDFYVHPGSVTSVWAPSFNRNSLSSSGRLDTALCVEDTVANKKIESPEHLASHLASLLACSEEKKTRSTLTSSRTHFSSGKKY